MDMDKFRRLVDIRFAVEGNRDLLERYVALAFTKFSGGGMGFYVNAEDLTTTQLRPLFIGDTGSSVSFAGGGSISSDGRFLRVCPAP